MEYEGLTGLDLGLPVGRKLFKLVCESNNEFLHIRVVDHSRYLSVAMIMLEISQRTNPAQTQTKIQTQIKSEDQDYSYIVTNHHVNMLSLFSVP